MVMQRKGGRGLDWDNLSTGGLIVFNDCSNAMGLMMIEGNIRVDTDGSDNRVLAGG